MKVSEIIERLKEWPADTPVVVHDDDRFLAIDEKELGLDTIDALSSGENKGTEVLVIWGTNKMCDPTP